MAAVYLLLPTVGPSMGCPLSIPTLGPRGAQPSRSCTSGVLGQRWHKGPEGTLSGRAQDSSPHSARCSATGLHTRPASPLSPPPPPPAAASTLTRFALAGPVLGWGILLGAGLVPQLCCGPGHREVRG